MMMKYYLLLASILVGCVMVHSSVTPLSSYYDIDPGKFIHKDRAQGHNRRSALHGSTEEWRAASAILLGNDLNTAPSSSSSYQEVPIDETIYPVCANVSYKAGSPDVTGTLYDCMTQIANPLLTPSYVNGSDTVEVLISYSFNNLMSLNELDGTVTMDFYFRLYWLDQRINVPTMWEALANTTNAYMVTEGVNIDTLLRNENDNLQLWLPDVQFVDGKEVEAMVETLWLRPGGILFWSRHVVATMQQPGFVYYEYPMDSQVIGVRVESYGYTSQTMLLGFADPTVYFPGSNFTPAKPVSFISNGDKENFNTNQLWTYDSYYTEILEPDYGINSGAAFFPQPVVYLRVTRKADGIINRLALPIMLMLMLVGMTFWKEMETRVDTTITILLAVSALYIVIFSNVPPIGYLTRFDKYIIAMFIMLVVTVFAHQIVDRMMVKADRYPLRMLLVRVIEYLGKQFIIPFVLTWFVITFSTLFDGDNDVLEWEDVTALVISVSAMSVYIFLREYSGLKRANRDCLLLIRVKVASPSAYELSTAEMLYFNYFSYGVCSRSASHFHRWLRSQEKSYAEEERARSGSNLSSSSDDQFGSGVPTAAAGTALPRTAKQMMKAWDKGDAELPDDKPNEPRSVSLAKRGGGGLPSSELQRAGSDLDAVEMTAGVVMSQIHSRNGSNSSLAALAGGSSSGSSTPRGPAARKNTADTAGAAGAQSRDKDKDKPMDAGRPSTTNNTSMFEL